MRTGGLRSFSQSARRSSYEDTARNLLITKDTKVICQGFTGKTVSIKTYLPVKRHTVSR